MNRRQKIIVSVTGIFLVLLILVGLTYAYFLTRITGNTNDKSISISTSDLALVYGDGNGIITADKIQPGTTLDTKTFTVTNEGNSKVTNYVVYLEDVENTFYDYKDIEMILTCESINSDTGEENGTCNGKEGYFPFNDDYVVLNDIDVGTTHKYNLTLKYKETNTDQSEDMGKILTGKIQIYDLREAAKLSISDQETFIQKIYNTDIEYGDEVNYNAGVSSYTGKWRLLGIEDGKLLLLSDIIGTQELSEADGFNNGVSYLNAMANPYGNGKFAAKDENGNSLARSIKAEDINKITNYNPLRTLDSRPYRYGLDGEYGCEATYVIENIDGQDSIVYTSTNGYREIDTDPKFLLYDGTQLGSTPFTVKSEFYFYLAQAIENPYINFLGINVMTLSQGALDMLKVSETIDGKSDADITYWLANKIVYAKTGNLSRGVMYLKQTMTNEINVDRRRLINSYDQRSTVTYGVRAVVYLEPGVTLTYDETNSRYNLS